VTRRILLFFEEVTRRRGISLERLCEGLTIHAQVVRSRSRAPTWDEIAALGDRFAELTSRDELARVGAEAFEGGFLVPFVRGSALFFTPARLYDFAVRFVGPRIFPGMRGSVRRLRGAALELELCIDGGDRSLESFFRMAQGALSVVPTFFDLPPAAVRCDVGPKRALYRVEVPPMPLRSRIRALGRLKDAVGLVGDLIAREDEVEDLLQQRARQAEEAAKAERLFRTVLNSLDEIVSVVRPDATLRFVSDAVTRVLGHRAEDLFGAGALENVYPGDLPRGLEMLAKLTSVPGLTLSGTIRVRARDGSLHTLEVTGHNLIDDPAVGGLLFVSRDVTEKLHTEARLRVQEQAYSSLLSNLSGMAYRCRNDEQWTMELVTDGAEELTGYAADELRDNRVVAFGSLILLEDAGPLWEKCQTNLAARRVCQNEYRIRTKGGEVRWVNDLAHGIYAEDGSLVAIEGFISDVTARRRLEEQLHAAQRLESVGRLAGGVAHDFNNLLGAMMGYASVAKDTLAAEDPVRADLEQIEAAIHRAAALTRQLLTFARRQPVAPAVLDLNALVMGMDGLLRRVLGEDIELVTVLAPTPWLIEADAAQVEQVILNLAVNARDAMPTGGRLVIETGQISFEAPGAELRRLPPGDYVMLAVTDTGMGMDAATLEHIFEPFFTTKEEGKGTGLGLATVYGIVAKNEGHIFVYSEVGVATTFKVYWPRTRKEAEPPAAREAIPAPRGSEAILVVEDHALMRDAMARTLREVGYDVSVAAGAAEARALLREAARPVDLLLADVVMPQTSGKALADELRADRPGLRVLFVSGYTENSIGHHGVSGADDHFLPKPFTSAQLAAKVREVLDSPLGDV
jgi:PAS domain S-box-containing protein